MQNAFLDTVVLMLEWGFGGRLLGVKKEVLFITYNSCGKIARGIGGDLGWVEKIREWLEWSGPCQPGKGRTDGGIAKSNKILERAPSVGRSIHWSSGFGRCDIFMFYMGSSQRNSEDTSCRKPTVFILIVESLGRRLDV